jgi:hypothetical protein
VALNVTKVAWQPNQAGIAMQNARTIFFMFKLVFVCGKTMPINQNFRKRTTAAVIENARARKARDEGSGTVAIVVCNDAEGL